MGNTRVLYVDIYSYKANHRSLFPEEESLGRVAAIFTLENQHHDWYN